MKLLENLTTDRRKVVAVALLIIALAAFLRFYNLPWSFSNNGVDEGIMLERARMVSEGYDLYTELPCDQAPLAFLIGSVFDGDVVALRALTAALSIAAIAMCMLASKKQQGSLAMMVTGLLLAVDFALVRESRLFSLDGLSSSFLAFSLPLFLHFIRRGSKVALACAGLLVGLSAATKLFGAVALLGMLLFLILEHMRSAKGDRSIRRTSVNLGLLIVSAAAPLAVLLLVLGPTDMLDGMVFDQGHRTFDMEMKLSVPIFFGLSLAYALPLVYVRRMWSFSAESRFLLLLSGVLLVNFIVQPLVFLHHMVIMSPGLAILSGMFVSAWHADLIKKYRIEKESSTQDIQELSRKKKISESMPILAVLVVGIMVSGGLVGYGLAVQGEPSQKAYAEKIASWTTPEDWIISGDPLITAYAERLTPPTMVNVGTRVYPMFDSNDVLTAVLEYHVAVFVFSYRFFEQDTAMVALTLDNSFGYGKVSSEFMGEWSASAYGMFEDTRAPLVFVRDDIIAAYDIPTEAWSL